MKFLPYLVLALSAASAHAGQRLGVASYGQTGSMYAYGQAGSASGYGQTAAMGGYSSGQAQGYSAGGVNADLGTSYSAAGARARSKGHAPANDSEASYSQPSFYKSPGSSTLQPSNTPK